jgi:hypothetical protein
MHGLEARSSSLEAYPSPWQRICNSIPIIYYFYRLFFPAMISKFRLTIPAILCCVFCHAQVQFAVFAGPQATTAHYTVDEKKQPATWKIGAMAGGAVKVPFDNKLFFFPSIYYSMKGYKVTLNDPSFPPTQFAKNNDVTVHTVEISPLFQIDFNKQPQHFFVRFGPAVDFAFSGREKFDTVSRVGTKGSVDRAMIFSFGDYGRITAQGNFHFGYETGKGLMLFAFYEHGIGSMNNADGGPKILHRIAGISAGWLFVKPVGH